jgi:hypothetical protein
VLCCTEKLKCEKTNFCASVYCYTPLAWLHRTPECAINNVTCCDNVVRIKDRRHTTWWSGEDSDTRGVDQRQTTHEMAVWEKKVCGVRIVDCEYLPSSSYRSSNCARTATLDPLLVNLQLPSVKLLILQLSVKRQPATFSWSIGTPTDLLPIPLRTLDTRQATTRPTAHATAPPKRHVVQNRRPQVHQIVTDHLPIP